MTSPTSSTNELTWTLFGRRLPKSEAVFFAQIILIYVVVFTCIINLSLNNGDSNLWTALLSGSLGSLLPNPSLKRHTVSPISGRLSP